MKKIFRPITAARAAGSLLVFASAMNAQEGDLLFQDSLQTDTSTDWTLLTTAPAGVTSDDWEVDFAWDYSEFGLPISPNAVDDQVTQGLRMKVNKFSGEPYGLTLVPNGENFTGNYVVKFDLWINFNGELEFGGPGSTQFASFGVGTDDVTPHAWTPSATADGKGAWFAVDGDGGNGWDYRALTNELNVADVDGGAYFARESPDFDAAQSARRWSQPYYHTAIPGGAVCPQVQYEMEFEAFNETRAGCAGFVWNEIMIEVIDGTVTWYINDLPIATVTPENGASAYTTDGNIFLGYLDHFPGVAAHDSRYSFAVYSNLRVHSLPSDANFASWAADNITDENARGAEDNPSGDGISNLLKYALGLDPAVADISGLPQGAPEDDGGQDYLTLTASKNPDAADVLLDVEVSDDLVNWDSGAGFTTVLLDDDNTLKVRDDTALSSSGRRFIRLNASLAAE